MNFKDEFSGQSAAYARYRPRYPRELLTWLASIAPQRVLAWDVGTGNGQCAVGLSEFFDKVLATDASAQQIGNATPAENVTYRMAIAQESGLADAAVDLVTVSQAVHWFDFDAFYAEVRRVLRPGGVIAVWCYVMADIEPSINELLREFDEVILRPFWVPNAQYLYEHFRTLPFPFAEITPPREFIAEASWTLADVLGNLESMSATQRFRKARGYDPADEIRERLAAVWGDPLTPRRAAWPLYMRVGRVG